MNRRIALALTFSAALMILIGCGSTPTTSSNTVPNNAMVTAATATTPTVDYEAPKLTAEQIGVIGH